MASTDPMVTHSETQTKAETSTASEVVQPGKVPNALAVAVPSSSNGNMEMENDDSDHKQGELVSSPLSPITEDFIISKDVLEVSIVHKHRLSHTPSKLPALRFVDRQIGQTTPTPGPDPAPRLLVASVSSPSNSTTVPGQPEQPGSPNSSSPPPPPTSAPDSSVSPLILSSRLHPVIVTDNDDSGLSLRRHSTASPNHQTPTSQTATAPTPTAVPAAKLGTPAALRRATSNSNGIRTPANTSSPSAPRSESGTDSSRYYTPATRPRGRRNSSWESSPSPLTARPPAPARRISSGYSISPRSPLASRSPGTTTDALRAHGQPQTTLPKPADLTSSNEQNKALPQRVSSTSRPPISSRPRLPFSTPGRIAPIRAFRPSGSRRSSFDMYNSSSRYYDDDGDEDQTHSSRDRSLRALEGRDSDDRPKDSARPNTDSTDDVAESENNTADIFMTIARENSSSSIPRRSVDQGSDDEQSTVVSSIFLLALAHRILEK